jgi:creatinine amidohydrolase
MLPKYEPVCYELLRPAQVKAIRERRPIVYVPAGSLEWHGLHNPLGTDSLKAHAICCEAALRHGGVVLPPFYLGLIGVDNWGPPGWGGYTLSFNEFSMLEAAMRGLMKALVYSQWRAVACVTGHDSPEQVQAMQNAIDAGAAGTQLTGFAMMEGDLNDDSTGIGYTMDHAAAWETSCMLYAYPEKVDLDTLRGIKLSNDECTDIRGPEGIGGANPLKYASAELGRRIIETMGDRIGRKARDMLAEQREQR